MKTIKKQTWRRKGAALGMLIFLLTGNGILFAKKEKPGAIIVVQKIDGQTSKGELIEVKNGTLTLLIYENATKVDIRLDELNSVRIEKKSAFLKSLGIGILAGAAAGALGGYLSGDDEPSGWMDIFNFTAGEKALGFGISLGAVGGVIGAGIGALKGIDKTITLVGLSPEKLRRIEAKLAARARTKPDPIAEFRKKYLEEPEGTSPAG
jgi:hypothetical protein